MADVKRSNIKDVARRAGVSVATVSRALAGSSLVRPETAQRIHEVVRELSYVPHNGARSLATNRTKTVGVLLPDLHGEFFSELMRGLDRAARGRGYHLLVSGFHNDRHEVEAVLRTTRGRVDGVIWMAPDADVRALRRDLLEQVPTVLLNCRSEHHGCDSLDVDNVGGAVAVVRHLAGLGHRRIAIVTGPASNHDAAERLRGFRRAVAELGLERAPGLEIAGDFTEQSGRLAAARLLALEPRPSAVFAANDDMAIGLIMALRASGVALPDELALAGFDDIPHARFITPPLTSVRVDIAELGARAMETLLGVIEAASTHQRSHDTLPAKLVVRESCGVHGARRLRTTAPNGLPASADQNGSEGGSDNEDSE